MGTIKETHSKNLPPEYTSLEKNSQGTAVKKTDKDNTTSVTFLENPDTLRWRSQRRGLGALRADEGLGESLDINIDNENSPKLDHLSNIRDLGGVKEGLAACLSPSLACNPESYDACSDVPKSPVKRVTFL